MKYKLKNSWLPKLIAVMLVFSFAAALPVRADNVDDYFRFDPPHNEFFPDNWHSPHMATGIDEFEEEVLWQKHMISERVLTRRQQGLDLRGNIPVIESTFGFSSNYINEAIENEIVTPLISQAIGRARAVTFRHDHYFSDDILSVVVYADIASAIPQTLVRSINFNVRTLQFVDLDDALGLDLTALATRRLTEIVRSDPANFNPNTNLENISFYLTDTQLVLLFNGFEFALRDGNVHNIIFERENLKSYTFVSDTVGPLVPPSYNLMSMPLRHIVESIGYEMVWLPTFQRVEIFRNGILIIELQANDNNYVLTGIMQVSLESAPSVSPITGMVFVPITFFDQVLPLTVYSIESNGKITFLSYIN